MNQIEKLIEELCPNGVEYKPLGELGTFSRGGGLQKKDFTESGVGCIHYGQIYTHYGIWATETKSFVSSLTFSKAKKAQPGDIIIADTSENDEDLCKAVAWLGEDSVAVSNHTLIFTTELNPKFVSYFLRSLPFQKQKRKFVFGTKVRSISGTNMGRILLPCPPLEIQQEIVKILDTFQSLEAELEAELEARKKQYEFYRDQLLTFTERERVRWVTLNETGSFYGGLTGKRKEDFANGSHNFISYKQIYSNISISSEGNSRVAIHPNEHQNEVHFGDILFTGSSESREEAGFTAVVTQEFQKPTYLNSFSIGFRPSDEYARQLNPEFTKFLFRCQSVRNQIMKAANGVTRFNVSKQRLGMIKVPIPPLEEQQRIVNILDKFDALVNDLTSGLPAEIEARRKQYEYYRDQLLTFKELAA